MTGYVRISVLCEGSRTIVVLPVHARKWQVRQKVVKMQKGTT